MRRQLLTFGLLICALSSSKAAEPSVWRRSIEGSAFPSNISADYSENWSQIVNGTITSQYPAVAALLRIRPDGGYQRQGHCTATLIGCKFLLTAAHCVTDKDPNTYVAWFQPIGFAPIKSVARVHQDFKQCEDDVICSTGDIALVELRDPVDGVRSVPFTKTVVVPPGDAGTIVGYGVSQGTRRDFGIKRRGSVQAARCQETLAESGDAAWLCWKYSSRTSSNTCSGDSGGPLFASNGALGGVTSTGSKSSCSVGDQAFDTRVSTYSKWIIEHAPNDIQPGACGAGAQAGDADAPQLMVVNDQYKPDGAPVRHSLTIPAGINKVVFSLQGVGKDFQNVRRISLRSRPAKEQNSDSSCQAKIVMNLATCTVPSPPAGAWEVLVELESSDLKGDTPFIYQVVATMFSR